MKSFFLLGFCLLIYLPMQADDYSLNSPDNQIQLRIRITDQVYYAVDFEGENLMWYSQIALELDGDRFLGKNGTVREAKKTEVRQEIKPVWGTKSRIQDHYNQLELVFEGDYSIVFRAYNDGVAYRFETRFAKEIIVKNEAVNWRFRKDQPLIAHVVGDFQTSYEKLYTRYSISKIVEEEFISLPLLVQHPKAAIAITEADVYDYPGMYIQRQGNNNRFDMQGLFPQYPTAWKPGGWCQFNLKVTQRASHIAQTYGNRSFPWRVMIIAREEKDLINSDLVYQLARPAAIETDWIKPGKVAWDWWNDWNLEGVDFETGINNQTYEYYIDFASRNGLEYIIMDEGWSDQFDLLLPKPEVDVPHLVAYAAERNVKIILWCVWHPLDRQMEAALDQFERWGVAGIKVDFIDRDDQIAINYYERLASEAAKRKLLVDYHGCSKPTGLHRTYPNVINYEGVRGNEYNKFATGESPQHNIDIVFTRMLAGPIDYTPGAMRNSTQGNFKMDNSLPMSQGTRCQQLGMYVVYYAPLQMLCDAPTAYEKYPNILHMLSQVPVSWDETVVLDGKVGEYVVIARRKGADWYIGALNNWTEREITLDLSFLDRGRYKATCFLDGMNAHRIATDYRVVNKTFRNSDNFSLQLKPGGGALIQLKK